MHTELSSEQARWICANYIDFEAQSDSDKEYETWIYFITYQSGDSPYDQYAVVGIERSKPSSTFDSFTELKFFTQDDFDARYDDLLSSLETESTDIEVIDYEVGSLSKRTISNALDES